MTLAPRLSLALDRSRTALRSVAVLLVLTVATSLSAQDENSQKPLLTVRKIEPSVDKGAKVWRLKVTGKNEIVPSGAKVEFQVLYRSAPIAIFEMVAGAPGSNFVETFTMKSAPVTKDKFNLVSIVRFEKQKGSVKAKLKKNKKSFPMNLAPWTQYHFEQRFQLIDPEIMAAEATFVRAFFMGHLKELVRLRKEVVAAQEKVKAAEAYVDKKGEFKESAWRKWMDKEIVPELKKVQEAALEAAKSDRFVVYRKESAWLLEISRCINHQVLHFSKGVYKAEGLPESPKDADAEQHGLDTSGDRRRKKSLALVEELAKRLVKSLPKAPAVPKSEKKPTPDKKPATPTGENERKGG